MPLYEFVCPKCGTKFEEIVRSTDTSGVTCEHCGFERPERQMSTFATTSDSSGSSTFASSGCGGSTGFS